MNLGFGSGVFVGVIAGSVMWSLLYLVVGRQYTVHALRQELASFRWQFSSHALNEAVRHWQNVAVRNKRFRKAALDTLHAQLLIEEMSQPLVEFYNACDEITDSGDRAEEPWLIEAVNPTRMHAPFGSP